MSVFKSSEKKSPKKETVEKGKNIVIIIIEEAQELLVTYFEN